RGRGGQLHGRRRLSRAPPARDLRAGAAPRARPRSADGRALRRHAYHRREAPDRELRGLEAARRDGRIVVIDVGGDPRRWEALFHGAANAIPAVFGATADQRAAIGGQDVPEKLLRLPLTVQSELVGMILAAGDVERFAA